jgi:FtsP/CotA-like multicopper oxidase with cupredoxin domain
MLSKPTTCNVSMRRLFGAQLSMHRSVGAASLAVALAGGAGTAGAQNAFHEPPVFASQNGTLDILMTAKPKPIPTITFTSPTTGKKINPQGWAYEICKRTSSGQTTCPNGFGTVWDYGGIRLALKQSDTLKVHFANMLPPFDPKKLLHGVDDPNDVLNPTNLHTHGLLTPARAATKQNPTWGDDIFVQVFNPANGMPNPASGPHNMGDVVVGPINYNIPVPPNHPSGLLWYHAHLHGIALEQLSAGTSGLLTIGSVGDIVTGDISTTPWPDANVRHLLLKDVQVAAAGTRDFGATCGNVPCGPQPVADGEIEGHTDAAFCNQFPVTATEVRQGSCAGVDQTANGDDNFTGGVWYSTVNGIQFPTIPITKPDGEIWRLGTGAGSVSWDLRLVNDQTGKPMPVQLIAIDGVAVSVPGAVPGDLVSMGGGKFHVVQCPNATTGPIGTLPVCIDEWVMMPSARVDLWVTYRDQNGNVLPSPSGASATLKMEGLTMGSGDGWPAVDLAKVTFNQGAGRTLTANQVNVKDSGLFAPGGMFVSAVPGAKAAPLPAGCAALPAGHRRRIFFGFSDVAVDGTFALGYEEVDQNGNVVSGSHQPDPNNLDSLGQFDANVTTVCLPLGTGQMPVTETWEIIQLATENHNFHLHQTRFIEKVGPSQGNVVQDNFPLGVAVPDATIADQVFNNQTGVCLPSQWRSGHCVSPAVIEQIAFSQLGEFVYHCHILEHEDGGMMARIVVVPSPN